MKKLILTPEEASKTPQQRYNDRLRELKRNQGKLKPKGRPKLSIPRYQITLRVIPEEELLIREFLEEMRNRESNGELK